MKHIMLFYVGSANGIRTHTLKILSLLPLPIGIWRHLNWRPEAGSNRQPIA